MPSKSDLASARQAAGLTQLEAAELAGVSLRMWQYCESGQRNMSGRAWALFQLRLSTRTQEASK